MQSIGHFFQGLSGCHRWESYPECSVCIQTSITQELQRFYISGLFIHLQLFSLAPLCSHRMGRICHWCMHLWRCLCAHDLNIPAGKYYLADAGFPHCLKLLMPYQGVWYHLAEWGCANIRCVSSYYIPVYNTEAIQDHEIKKYHITYNIRVAELLCQGQSKEQKGLGFNLCVVPSLLDRCPRFRMGKWKEIKSELLLDEKVK